MRKCKYYEGGNKKYVLAETYSDIIPFSYSSAINSSYACFDLSNRITIYKGYEWDGASGPTIDTENTMDGSLVHDVMYQWIREGFLKMKYRKEADKCIRDMCIIDGMSKLRANYWYFFLRLFGRSAACA